MVEALTIRSVAEQVGKALDKTITVIDVPLEAIVEGAVSHGLPLPVATMIASFDAATKAGHLGVVTSDFAKLVGKDPESFNEWLPTHKALFAPKS